MTNETWQKSLGFPQDARRALHLGIQHRHLSKPVISNRKTGILRKSPNLASGASVLTFRSVAGRGHFRSPGGNGWRQPPEEEV
jgi:hypothetical protein